MLCAMQQDPKPFLDEEPLPDGWHQRRWFWILFWALFFPALIYCLFPAKSQPQPAPAAAAVAKPLVTRQLGQEPPAPMTPIADISRDAPPTAVLQGEIVIEGPLRTAIRPAAAAGPGAATTK